MAYYRLYFLDRRGHFGRVEVLCAENDERAIQRAELLGGQVRELWCGGRRVKQWQASAAA